MPANKFKRTEVLMLLFFLSGAVSLLYEIVWAKQLQFLFGSSSYSISTILSSFFCGMALGSYLLGKRPLKKKSIIIYAGIEIIIGIYCLLSVFIIDAIDSIYLTIASTFFTNSLTTSLLTKFLLSFFVLIIPSALMGGSLPVLSRHFSAAKDDRGQKIGSLYGINTFGAVVGAFVTGFYLIETYGLSNTAFIGAGISLAIGSIAFLYGKIQPEYSSEYSAPAVVTTSNFGQSLIAYGITGFCALGLEVLWTRILLQALPSSTYTFSLILILYLLGIALGSLVGSRLISKIKSPPTWFALVQIALAFCIIGSAWLSETVFVFDPGSKVSWMAYLFAMGLKTFVLIFIPCLLLGSLFPIMVQWYKSKSNEVGDVVGKIYSANTLGGVLGSFSVGFVLLPTLGLNFSLVALAGINLILGLYFVRQSSQLKNQSKGRYYSLSGLLTALFLTIGFSSKLFNPFVAEGYQLLFYNEGSSANVSVHQSTVQGRENVKILKVNGVYQSGGTDEHALLVQRRQGHLPMLLHPQPESVLAIGLATGISLSAIAEHQELKRLDCVEIVPSQVKAASLFKEENNHILSDKRLTVFLDDGRSYVKTSKTKYDLIVGDLFQVSSAGTPAMYSLKHIQACKAHLNENGIMVQYMPLQQIAEDDLKSVIQSFNTVFPYVQLWVIDASALKPVLAVVASKQLIRLNPGQLKQKIENSRSKTLAEIGYTDPYLFLNQCIMQTETVNDYIKNSLPILLDKPVIEFSSPKILIEPRAKRIQTIVSNLIKKIRPLRIEVPNENADSIITALGHYATANKNNLVSELALGMQKWDAAEKLLSETIQNTPQHFDTRRLLGRTHVFKAIELLQSGHKKDAIIRLKKAKKLGIKDILVSQLLEVSTRNMQ